jgi:hypothetical protein
MPRIPVSSMWCDTAKTAMEMTSLWKPKSGSHRDLEISPRTRDSHIPTADHPLSLKGEDEERRFLGATSDQSEDLNDLDLRICLDKWVHFKMHILGAIADYAEREIMQSNAYDPRPIAA